MPDASIAAQAISVLEALLGAAESGESRCAALEASTDLSAAALCAMFAQRHPEVTVARASGSPWEHELPGGLLEQLGVVPTGGISVDSSTAEGQERGQPGPAWLAPGRAALEGLGALASERPVLLVLEALEHSDPLSLEALAYALRRLGRSHLATAILVGTPTDQGDAVAVFTEAIGVRSVAIPGPTLAALPAASRALVEAVSALSGSPAAADAAQLAGLPTDASALLATAGAAWASGLLMCWNDTGTLRLAFQDSLVGEAVHAGLGPELRAQLHTRAARLAGSTRERIRHLVAAAVMHDAELAVEADGLAAAEAADGDWQAAAEALLAASRLHVDPALREARLLGAAEAMIGAGDLTRAALVQPQIEAFPQSPARDAVLAYYAIHKGHARRAAALLDRAWHASLPETNPDSAAQIAQHRVLDSLARWDIPALLDWTATAVRLAGADSAAGIEARAMLGLGLGSAGRRDEARRAYDELAASPHLGARDQRLHLGRGWLALALDELDEARLALRAAIPTAARPGSLRIALWAHAWLARAEFTVGRWDDALAVCKAGLALNGPVHMDLVAPLLHWTAAQIHALRGERAAAARHHGLATSGPESYPVMQLAAAMAGASLAESTGDYGAVLRAFEPVVRLDRSRGIEEPGFWPWQDVYANALVMTGSLCAADAFLRPLEEAAAAADHRSTMARLAYVRGRLLGVQGNIDAAVERFQDALDRLDGLPMPYGAARVRFAYGQTLRRAGRRRDATAVLATARDDFISLGATVYVARCDRELQAAGTGIFRTGREPSSGASAPVSVQFTAQEEAVARLVAEGNSNREVARELFVSVKTVQYHLTRIYTKLGIGSRSELAAVFRARRDPAEKETGSSVPKGGPHSNDQTRFDGSGATV